MLPTAPAPSISKQHILLVDDSDDDLFLMRTAFKRANLETPVREVRDGEEAIEYLSGAGRYADREAFPFPTTVLLDLHMPRKNGFEVLSWAKSQPGLKRFTIIVLSASSRTDDLDRALDAGSPSAYLVKPTTLDGLVTMVRCLGEWQGLNRLMN